jgi:hypothetical protein
MKIQHLPASPGMSEVIVSLGTHTRFWIVGTTRAFRLQLGSPKCVPVSQSIVGVERLTVYASFLDFDLGTRFVMAAPDARHRRAIQATDSMTHSDLPPLSEERQCL